ncbi:MAG: hypothetical protein FWF75_05975 [Propionibacteriaceae bacterium]|nr:hypothetical protein [Propionibacteriaceae bacterium]
MSTHFALTRTSDCATPQRPVASGFSPLQGARRALLAALVFAVPTGIWCIVAAGVQGAVCALLALAVVAIHYLVGLPIEMVALRRADVIGLGLVLIGYVVRLGLLAAMLWLVLMWSKGTVDARELALCVVLPTIGYLVGLSWNALRDRTPTVVPQNAPSPSDAGSEVHA